MTAYNIAVLSGDGIGPEVIAPCLEILELLATRVGDFQLHFQNCAAAIIKAITALD